MFSKKPKFAWTTHTNPDGTEGGRVAEGATIGHNVTIKKTARVLPGATVPDNAVVELGTFVDADGPFKLTN